MVWLNPFHITSFYAAQQAGLTRIDQVKFKIVLGAQLILNTGLWLSILANALAYHYSRCLEVFCISLSLFPVFILLKRYPYRIATLYFISISILDAFLVAVLRINKGVDVHVENNYYYIVCFSIYLLDGKLSYFFALLSGLLGIICRSLAIYYLQESTDVGQYFTFVGPLIIIIFFSNLVKKLTEENQISIEHKNQQLSELNSLKDQLFNIISHDLRIPVFILKMEFEQLRDRNPKSKRVTISLDEYRRLVDSVDKLYITLDNLLQWSLLQREAIGNRPVYVDLSELLQSTLVLYDNQLHYKDLNLQTKLEPAEVFVDEYQAQIIIRNILHNAIKFSPPGSYLYLQTKAMADGATLTITDSGIGMDETTLSSLAKSVVSRPGTNGEKGTGIGLQLVNELVEVNGGQFTIQSQIGEGTTVEVLFPKKGYDIATL